MTRTEFWADPARCQAHWGERRGRPWSTGELDDAKAMRASGSTSEQIGAVLNRTARSIDAKLGHQRKGRRA